MYDFQKYKIMKCLGLTILNETDRLENSIDDQVYLKEAIDNLKKSTTPTLKN